MSSNGCCSSCCYGPQMEQPGQHGEHPGTKYGKTFKTLGILQIMLGICSIVSAVILFIFAGITMDFSYGLIWTAPGIWCGAFFLAAGILGTKSATYPSQCMITAAMVVTIFAALFSVTLMSLGITGACIAADYYNYYYPYPGYYPYPEYNLTMRDAQVAFQSVLAVIGFIELIISITHSSYCCAANCCRAVPPTTTTQTFFTTIPAQGPVLTAPNQYGVPEYRYVVQGQPNPGYSQGVGGPPMPIQHVPVNHMNPQNNQGPAQNQTPPPQYTDKSVTHA